MMANEKDSISQKQMELKNLLKSGRYASLADVILDGTGQVIKTITRTSQPISAWYSGMIIGLMTLFLSFFVSILLGETGENRVKAIPIEIWTVALGVSFLIAIKVGLRVIYDTLGDNAINAIEKAEDIDDLQRWLTNNSSLRKQLLFSLFVAGISTVSSPLLWTLTRGAMAGFGPLIRSFIFGFATGLGLYFFIPLITLYNHFGKYQFKLYKADPSNSEVIDRLSGMLSQVLYILAAIFVVITLGFWGFGFYTPITALFFLGVVTWGPLLVIFVNGQYALSRIINRSKWQTLNDIQSKIEKLQKVEEIPSQETIEHVRALMDYHDHIKNTKESALSLRSALNLLNSLLLPLLTFLLTNLDRFGILP